MPTLQNKLCKNNSSVVNELDIYKKRNYFQVQNQNLFLGYFKRDFYH